MSASKSGRELWRSTGSAASGLPASKRVAARAATSPPAEKPMIPMRAGVRFHSADRALGVGEGMFLDLVCGSGLARQAVFEHEGGDADAVQVGGDIRPLLIEVEEGVAAARGDDHGGAAGFAGGRQIDGQRGLVYARHLEGAVVLVGRFDHFGGGLARGTGGAVGPETDLGSGGGWRYAAEQKQKHDGHEE